MTEQFLVPAAVLQQAVEALGRSHAIAVATSADPGLPGDLAAAMGALIGQARRWVPPPVVAEHPELPLGSAQIRALPAKEVG